MTRRILCLGDSNTWGFDPRSYGGDRYPPEIRWTDRLAAAGRAVVNAGLNAAVTGASNGDTATVIAQSPAAGTAVPPATVVTVELRHLGLADD